jgi:AcrR family transcriptional regulator
MATKVTATDGRVIGQRAQETRRKLLDATAAMLATEGSLDLKVIDIARSVGSSPATFYQYFEDVDAALLASADEAGEHLAELEPLVTTDWDRKNGLAVVRTFVAAFIDYWDEHQAILRLRNLRSEENDPRFRKRRLAANAFTMDRFVDKVDEAKQAGRLAEEMNSLATAGAVMAILERLAAFHVEFERRGVARPDMNETVARLVYQTLTGYVAV